MLRAVRKVNLTIYQRFLQTGRVRLTSHSKWSSEEVRKTFVEYFVDNHQHQHVQSSAVAPLSDPTLLFTNAGMNQFKPIFTGDMGNNSPLKSVKRVVNSQKCIRAGGKHNDLDDVGKDSYHHTFFEMLGTWSFGDYFKKEAIDWAYDLLVNVYHLPKEHIYVSYFAGDCVLGLPADEESRQHWLKYFPGSRVLPFGKKENFWEMGDVGPCGPCSEIHFDRLGASRAPGEDVAALVNMDDPHVLEIWNIVFMQHFRGADGELQPLPARHIDSGMGLERLVSVLQNKSSNYDTDLFVPLFEALHQSITADGRMLEPYGGRYGADDACNGYRDTAYRVIADHARACSFALADGVAPSSDGRGYVLRRIIRRALRYGVQNLGARPGFFSQLLPVLCASPLGAEYPELRQQQQHIVAVALDEETSFARVLDRGTKEFQLILLDLISQAQTADSRVFPGERAFYLHDSLGFPVDLTVLMAEEAGYSVDMPAFDAEMNRQRALSSSGGSGGSRASRCTSVAHEDESESVFAFTERISLSTPNIGRLAAAGVAVTDDCLKYRHYIEPSDSHHADLSVKSCAVILKGDLMLLPSDLQEADQWGEAITVAAGSRGVDLEFGLVLTHSPFYAEAGGQVADRGLLRVKDNCGSASEAVAGVGGVFTVVDVQSFGGYVLHQCKARFPSGVSPEAVMALFWSLMDLSSPVVVEPQVDYTYRKDVATNHTMTHVLNHALTSVLAGGGATVNQKGSLVTDSKLRFDYSVGSQPSLQQVQGVERFVNDVIQAGLPVTAELMPLQDALGLDSVRAMFGETYPDPVRVVSIAGQEGNCRSIELCGGTHMENTADAGSFVVVEEESVAKGVRRMVAVTQETASNALANAAELQGRQMALLREAVAAHENSLRIDDAAELVEAAQVHAETLIKAIRAALSSNDADGLLPYTCRSECRLECDALARSFSTAVSKHNISKLNLVLGRVTMPDAPPIASDSFVCNRDVVGCSTIGNVAATTVVVAINCLPATDSASIKHCADKLTKQLLVHGAHGALLLVVLEAKDVTENQASVEYSRASFVAVTSKDAQKSKGKDAGALLKSILEACKPLGLNGRGGGKAGFAQGSIQLDQKTDSTVSIEDVLNNIITAASVE